MHERWWRRKGQSPQNDGLQSSLGKKGYPLLLQCGKKRSPEERLRWRVLPIMTFSVVPRRWIDFPTCFMSCHTQKIVILDGRLGRRRRPLGTRGNHPGPAELRRSVSWHSCKLFQASWFGKFRSRQCFSTFFSFWPSEGAI